MMACKWASVTKWLVAYNAISLAVASSLLIYFGVDAYFNEQQSGHSFMSNRVDTILKILDYGEESNWRKTSTFFCIFIASTCIVILTSIFGLLIGCVKCILPKPAAAYGLLVFLNAGVNYSILGLILTKFHHIRTVLWSTMEAIRQGIAVENSVTSSNTLNDAGRMFHEIQTKLSCCGGYGPGDWASSADWFIEKYQKLVSDFSNVGVGAWGQIVMFPCFSSNVEQSEMLNSSSASWCLDRPTSDCMKLAPPFLKGCYYAADEVLRDGRCLILAIVVTTAFIQLFGMVLSVCYLWTVNKAANCKPNLSILCLEDVSPQSIIEYAKENPADVNLKLLGYHRCEPCSSNKQDFVK